MLLWVSSFEVLLWSEFTAGVVLGCVHCGCCCGSKMLLVIAGESVYCGSCVGVRSSDLLLWVSCDGHSASLGSEPCTIG